MTLNMMLDNAAPEAIAGALTQQHPGLFFTMVEQASVAISLTDASARIIYANPAFCRQTGYSLAQLLNQNPRLLASSQTPREIYQEMWHTLLQRQPWRGQLINQRRDGGLYLVEIDITPVLSPQGELEHYLAMQRDISVSYTLEQRLRNHMTLIEAVLNNIPAAVVVVDEQDRVVMDNLAYKTFCADCGGREHRAAGLPWPDDARRGGDPAGGAPRGRALAVSDLLAVARRQRRGQPLLYRQRAGADPGGDRRLYPAASAAGARAP